MTSLQLANALCLKTFVLGEDKPIKGFYIGDLLSWVMGRVQSDSCWLTVMNNANVCAVAKLTDVACILLCEGVVPDQNLLERAKKENISIFGSDLPLFETSQMVFEKVKNAR